MQIVVPGGGVISISNEVLDCVNRATRGGIEKVGPHCMPHNFSQIEVPSWCCTRSSSIDALLEGTQDAGTDA